MIIRSSQVHIFSTAFLSLFLVLLMSPIGLSQSGGTPAPIAGNWSAPDGGGSTSGGTKVTIVNNTGGNLQLTYELTRTTEEQGNYVVYDSAGNLISDSWIPASPFTVDVTVPAGGILKVYDPFDGVNNIAGDPAGTYTKV